MTEDTHRRANRREPSKSSRLLVWTGIDQGFSAIANLLGAVLVARTGSAETLGVFALAFAVYLAGLGLVRASVGDPIVVSIAGRSEVKAAWAPAWVILVPSVVGGVALLAAGAAMVAIILLCLPLLFVQSALRYAAYARRQPQLAALNDGAWVLTTLALGIVVLDFGDPVLATAAWAAGGVVAAGVAVLSLQAWPASMSRSLRVARRVGRGLSWPLMGESLAVALASTLLVPVVLALISLQYAGLFRAAAVIAGPIAVAMTAWELYAFPAVSRAPERQVISVAQGKAWLGGLLGAGTLLVTSLLHLPLQTLLFDGAIGVPLWMILVVGSALVVAAVAAPAQAILKRRRLGSRLLRMRLLSLLPAVALAGVGLSLSAAVPVVSIPVVTAAAFVSMAWGSVRADAKGAVSDASAEV